MPPRSKVGLLPSELQSELEQRLMKNGFSEYVELSLWLAERGYSIGKSALQEHGSKLQRKLEAISTSVKAAKILQDASPDEEDALGAATMSMLQTRFFNLMVALQEVEDAEDAAEQIKLVSKAARAAADLQRASTGLKKWQAQVREKSKAAADTVAKLARKGGLSHTSIDEIKREILGIAR